MTVVAGNGTLEAARALGWATVAITRIPATWTSDEARAYALADNRTAELATWDDDALGAALTSLDAAGWDLNELGFDGLPPLDGGDDDDTPDPPDSAHTQPGDIWILGPHRLLCGSSADAIAVQRLFAGADADLILTDPPYGVAYESRGRTQAHKAIANDDASDADLTRLILESLTIAHDHARTGAPIYVFHADSKRAIFESAFLDAGWKFHQTIQWVKDSLVLARTDYQPQHEPILYGWKAGGRHSWHGGRKLTTIIDAQPDFASLTHAQLVEALTLLHRLSDVQRYPRPRSSEEHPTMKPVGLLARLVVNSSRKTEIIYDPFLGSGSTLIAAERQQRICYGVELDPSYCDVIVRRWQADTGGRAVLETTGDQFPS